jgi:hypothetical protein
MMLAPHYPLALRSPYKEVDGRANNVRQDNNQYPDHLIVAFRRLVGRAIDNHPDLENRAKNSDQTENAVEE